MSATTRQLAAVEDVGLFPYVGEESHRGVYEAINYEVLDVLQLLTAGKVRTAKARLRKLGIALNAMTGDDDDDRAALVDAARRQCEVYARLAKSCRLPPYMRVIEGGARASHG